MNLQNLVGELMDKVTSKENAQGARQPGWLSAALPSLSSSQVSETVSNLAGELDSGQRGNLVGSMLSGLGSAEVDMQSLLGRLGINPQVADNPEQSTPEEAAALAAHAHENHPGIVQSAMSLYEEHPTLIKTLGLFAAAAIAEHVYEKNEE